MKKISIIIPIFNEIMNINQILEKVNEAGFCGLEKEIILVDDFSTDGSREFLKGIENKYRVFYHDKNMGKGAALKTGFAKATGDIIAIQDADLEYNPCDYDKLIEPILSDEVDVCYGSRFLAKDSEKNFLLLSFLANKTLTIITNLLFHARLTDMETCYKAFKTEFIKNVTIKSNRFDFEPEITAKVLKKGARIKEIPISYNGREYIEGKKITWKDGVSAIFALLKFKFTD